MQSADHIYARSSLLYCYRSSTVQKCIFNPLPVCELFLPPPYSLSNCQLYCQFHSLRGFFVAIIEIVEPVSCRMRCYMRKFETVENQKEALLWIYEIKEAGRNFILLSCACLVENKGKCICLYCQTCMRACIFEMKQKCTNEDPKVWEQPH